MNKVFEKYWYFVAFGHLSDNDETHTDVDAVVTWLYGLDHNDNDDTTTSDWKDETIKLILFAVTNLQLRRD